VAIQGDGRIVVSYSSAGVLQLLRLNADGTFDTSFDGDGKVTLIRPKTLYVTSVAIQPDGKILVAGDEFDFATEVGGNFFVARYSSAGELDGTFGSGGVGLSTENNLPRAGLPNVEIALQGNGKMIVCGWTDTIAETGGHVSDFAVARFLGDDALTATVSAPDAVQQTLTTAEVEPLLSEAVVRWQAAGADTSDLGNLQIQITNLGGTTLGLASGHTIWLDDNAAGWGWFVDSTPWDDSEFTTPGNQGEQNRMDLLTVLAHEIGHLLGHDHEEDGVMLDTLATAIRRLPGGETDWLTAVDVLFAEACLYKRRW
jgi:uncharacterized delta-60 repeat protein